MKSSLINSIGEVVTDYGARVMKVFKKGLLGRSLFDFYGDIKADALRTNETASDPSTPIDGEGGIIYTKSADGKLYYKSNEVAEVEISANGGHTDEDIEDIAGNLVATGGTKTGIAITYDDANGDMDFVVDHDAATNFVAEEHYRWDNDIQSTATINHANLSSDTSSDGEVLVVIDGDAVWGHPEKIHLQVRNDEGSTIPAGAPLYSKGEIGGSNRILVGICDADDSAKMPCIGLAEAEMNTTSTKDNFAITQGVYNTNISGFTGLAVGDTLYVDTSGSAPYLTKTKPTGESSLIQNVGIVLKTNGSICQGLQVSAIGRTNDVPNLDQYAIFLGNASNQAVATDAPMVGLITAANSGQARTLLNVDPLGTDNSTNVTLTGTPDYITISGQEITRNAIDLTADVSGTLPVANGGTGATTATAARTALGVDAAGTDNSTNVTIAGEDYLSLSGQEITANDIDLTDNVTGTLPVANGGTGQTDLSNVSVGTAAALTSGDKTIDGDLTVNGDIAIGNDAEITSVGHMNFRIDSDSNESTQRFQWKNNASDTVVDLTEYSDLTLYGTALGDPKITLNQSNQTSTYGAPTVELFRNSITIDNADIGQIDFRARDSSGGEHVYAQITGMTEESGSGTEGGKIKLKVASHDGEVVDGLIIEDGDAEDEVDVTIANGADSLTTVAGNLNVTGSVVGKMTQFYSMSFIDDLNSSEHFLPWKDINEQTFVYQEEASMIMPYDGRIKSVTMRMSAVAYSAYRTLRILTFGPNGSQFTRSNWTEEEAETLQITSTDDNHVFHFVFDNAKHFESGELVAVAIQDSTDLHSGFRYCYVTVEVEFDMNNGLGTSATSGEYDSAQ